MRKNKKYIHDVSEKDFEKPNKSMFIKNRRMSRNVNFILKLLGKIFVCFILISIIVFSIVTTALTVYVMKAKDTETDISLEKQSIVGSEFTQVFAYDEKNKPVKLNVIDSGVKRIWVDISDVPQIVKDAVVVTEDNKFYEHDGVDFWRTFGAFSNMFLHFWKTNQGGSTITQQLLKNITGERQVHGIKGIIRKVNEIYKAMGLERRYSKDQILQAYLNIIYVGYGNYLGIATAAKLYFNKNLKDINLQEAATLAAMIKNPGNMLKNKDKVFDRRNYVLRKMYELGKITKQEAEKAKKMPLNIKKGNISKERSDEHQSYFVDTALNEVVDFYMKRYKIKDWNSANERMKKSGLKIYTTIDLDMQKKLEENYEQIKCPPNVQSAMIVFSAKDGTIKACVGGVGKKPIGDRATLNYATNPKALIGPGSTMKAFVCGYEIENNRVTYSSVFKDAPFKIVQNKPWPENIGNKHSDKMVTLKYAIQKSLNTVPTKILEDSGRKGIIGFCDFLENKLKFSTISNPKKPKKEGCFETSAMAMGSLTNGVVLSELTSAFQIFANGGKFTPPTTLKKVSSQKGDEIYKSEKKTITAISKDSAAVMNRLLRNVISKEGTGYAANLDSMAIEVVGKTGTSNDGKSLTFVGATPNYVAGIWFGSTNGKDISKSSIKPAAVWGNIMRSLMEKKEKGVFSTVAAKEQIYCAASGFLANSSCPNKEKGYYKRDNFLTKRCNLHN